VRNANLGADRLSTAVAGMMDQTAFSSVAMAAMSPGTSDDAESLLPVLWGSSERRVTLHQVPLGKLLQHIPAGAVFVVAAVLTPVVPEDRRSRNTCGGTSRILRVADLAFP
jgi:hypothetical protein